VIQVNAAEFPELVRIQGVRHSNNTCVNFNQGHKGKDWVKEGKGKIAIPVFLGMARSL